MEFITKHKIALLVIVSVITSILIGVIYGNMAFIRIYPFLFWLWAIAICFFAFFSIEKNGVFHHNRTELVLLFLMMVAFSLRVVNLNLLPGNFHLDEDRYVRIALEHIFNPINNGDTVNPFRTGNDSQPFMYNYVLRLGAVFFGYSITGVRITSVIAGSIAIIGVFIMVNEMAGRKTAWLAAILMTTYHYHIHWSRLALNNIWSTLLIPLTLGLFLMAWRKSWKTGALLAGICLGSAAYFYAGGYIIIFLALILILQVWKSTKDYANLLIYVKKMLIMAFVVAAPLITFAVIYPQRFFGRVREIYGWYPELILPENTSNTPYWDYFIYQMSHSFGAYNFYTEVTGFYRPNIPFLIGTSSILFIIGFIITIYKKQYFPIIWIVIVTVFGGVLSFGTPSSSHFISAIPAICWLVAIPLNWMIEQKKSYLAYFLLGVIVITDIVFYFFIYTPPASEFIMPFPSIK